MGYRQRQSVCESGMSVIQFLGNYLGRSKNISALQAVNLFPVLVNNGQGIALFGTPGTSLYFSIGSQPARCVHKFGDNIFVVCRQSFYKINLAGTVTLINSLITTTTGYIGTADNGIELLLVDGQNRYVYNFTSEAFTVTADTADTCTFLDGFFIKSDNTTSDFYISDAYDGLTWGGLNKARAESRSDNIVRVFATFSTLMLFGTTTTEIWYNDGSTPVPFSRMQGGTMNIGLLAVDSVVQTGTTGDIILWLATIDQGIGSVVKMQGGAPIVVTTKEIEFLWGQYSRIDDAVAYSYREEGIAFYVINFPSANKTWALDVDNGVWHERSTNGGRHIGHKYVFFNNTHLVSDYKSGNFYIMDMDIYIDNGDSILRKIVSPHIGSDENRITFRSLQVDMEEGVGLIQGQGSDPTLMLRWSVDRGHTWGNEHRASFGKIGEYAYRVIFRKLGRSFSRTFEFTISDPVKVVIINFLIKTE